MSNRFEKKQTRDFGIVKSLLLPVGLFVAVLLFFQVGLERLSATTQQEQLKAAQDAVVRAVVQCYALEGEYPPNVEYLEEHYGLQVDRETYIVHYEIFAGNIMPDVQVMPRYF